MTTQTTHVKTPAGSADAGVKKTGDTVVAQGRFTVKNPFDVKSFDLDEARKPLFAFVGVADYALEQVKELPTLYVSEAKKAQEAVQTLPNRVQELRGEVETRFSTLADQADKFYAELAVRGERLVTSIRRQPSTEAAMAEGKEAVRKAEAAATAAKKSAKAGEKAVEDASTKIG